MSRDFAQWLQSQGVPLDVDTASRVVIVSEPGDVVEIHVDHFANIDLIGADWPESMRDAKIVNHPQALSTRPVTGAEFIRWLVAQGVAIDPDRVAKVTLTATPESLLTIAIEQTAPRLAALPNIAVAPTTIREK